jgi:glutathione peroxidase-family protein
VTIYDIPVKTLAGEESSLGALAGKTLLVVNVASKCGLKFLLGPDGAVIARFRPRTVPDDPEVLAVIEENLPG